MNIRNSGVFGDSHSGGGLYEGVPSEALNRRSWFTYEDDFSRSTFVTGGATGDWTDTYLTSGSAAITAGAGGLFTVVMAAANDQGAGSIQLTSTTNTATPILPVAGRTIVFDAIMTMTNWDASDWFIGLAGVDTTFMQTTGVILATGGDNCVGFGRLHSASNTSPMMTHAGTAVANIVRTATGLIYDTSVINSTFYSFGFRIYGLSTLEFYFGSRSTGTTEPGGTRWDTRLLSRVTMGTALAGLAMVPTIAMISSGAADIMSIDRIFVAQTR